MARFPLTPDEFAEQRRSTLLYAIESPDGARLYYQAETLEGILNAAACMRDDFPDREFVVLKGGEYDGQATLVAQEGLLA